MVRDSCPGPVVSCKDQRVNSRAVCVLDYDRIRNELEQRPEPLLDEEPTEEFRVGSSLLYIPGFPEQVGLSRIQQLIPIVVAPDAIHAVAHRSVRTNPDSVVQLTPVETHRGKVQ